MQAGPQNVWSTKPHPLTPQHALARTGAHVRDHFLRSMHSTHSMHTEARTLTQTAGAPAARSYAACPDL